MFKSKKKFRKVFDYEDVLENIVVFELCWVFEVIIVVLVEIFVLIFGVVEDDDDEWVVFVIGLKLKMIDDLEDFFWF